MHGTLLDQRAFESLVARCDHHEVDVQLSVASVPSCSAVLTLFCTVIKSLYNIPVMCT
jgi:hypothetical protein